ncbi:hypothetical protein GSI_15325 [Ganoderma sinense ZZ0214-1]|uniref:YEATS domain-containing protein n=1 Tax=Ganoderma sinense ZZ0214-1 TaxID=1077348 RepID=A0A2G8RM91_9APHY|nr:hypothetical protein GSI_15325 [Ganoderma sinense ZZ0214-1]
MNDRENGDGLPMALEEIDLEIAIRRRIAETIQSRMNWALLLQESVPSTVGQGYENFRAASLDALDAIEAPCNLVFNRENPLVPIPAPRPPNDEPPPIPSSPEPPQMLRVGSRTSRARAFARAPLAPPRRLLFLRNTATTPPEIAKLACPRCSRFDFSNLQGLLNHCRIRHQLEYGSHDECVQSCAVLVPEEERVLVVQNGVEVAGISLPSLRRLFEIAVGAGNTVRLPPPSSKSATPAPTAPKTEIKDELNAPVPPVADMRTDSSVSSTSQPMAHVTKTLGYHVDTPALAQFLGRVPKQRRINVRANEDDVVDIEDTSGESGLQLGNMWRKPYTHRNAARKDLDEVIPLAELHTNGVIEKTDYEAQDPRPDAPSKEKSSGLQMLAGTRFHIAARIQVSDFSLYIPSNRRPPDRPNHSYRWRIAVTSPSYSLPVSSVLRKLTVSSATDPPPSALSEPITLSEPPFVITGTTDQPFLARLAFTWAGPMNTETNIEHWVELDPMQYTTAQLGDEQVFDVELDRHTELLPVRDDVRAVSWEGVQSTEHAPAKPDVEDEQERERDEEPRWVGELRSLLPQFPMTMRDTRGRVFAESDNVPYTLVATPAQFRNLNYGRRKAIEMARARALREAYDQHVSQLSQEPAHPSFEAAPPADRETAPQAIPADTVTLTQLSTVDVLRWLEDEGLIPRSNTTISQVEVRKRSRGSRKRLSGPPAYCRACGLERAWHPTLLEERSVAGNTPGTTTETQPSTSVSGRHHKDLNLASLVCTTFEEAKASRSPVVNVDADWLCEKAGRGCPISYTLRSSREVLFTKKTKMEEKIFQRPPLLHIYSQDPRHKA